MRNKRTVISLNTPRVEGNKIFLSWEQSPIFKESSYWIEYVGLKELDCRPEALLEAYLPICIALSFLGEVTIKLPGYVDPVVLETWRKTCTDTSRVLGKRTANIEFITSDSNKEYTYENKNFKETALLFGGGSESLLTLAHLLDRKISPYLASLWGEGWIGSDPSLNRERFDLEKELCQEFQLKIIRIQTNARTIFHKKNFKPYLRQKVFIIDAAFMLPINISVLLPVAEQLNIGTIASGNEKEASSDIQVYSLSSEMTRNLNSPGKYVKYYSDLESLPKIEVLKELHQRYPNIARYQYSCFSAINARWCLNCEKCFRNYIIYKIFDIDPMSVGIDEAKILQNFGNNIRIAKEGVRKSKARFKEWSRIKKEAIEQDKKEIVKVINLFYKNILLRKIHFFLKGL